MVVWLEKSLSTTGIRTSYLETVLRTTGSIWHGWGLTLNYVEHNNNINNTNVPEKMLDIMPECS